MPLATPRAHANDIIKPLEHMNEFFLISDLFPPPQPPTPARQALFSVTRGPWYLTPVSQLHRKEATTTLSEVSLFFFFPKLFPPSFFLPTVPPPTHPPFALTHSPALLHTSLVVNDTSPAVYTRSLQAASGKESVVALLHIFTEWVSGNALPNINEAN
uniref:Uncharacterized protein n=1 Tax=Pipistrellus kuhlii TaxID=59472 RepID=A0A7J7ZJ68_PIPKU|nr:hypothetical protein mPipKuh1_009437 [Pipistrellus kuhlii]